MEENLKGQEGKHYFILLSVWIFCVLAILTYNYWGSWDFNWLNSFWVILLRFLPFILGIVAIFYGKLIGKNILATTWTCSLMFHLGLNAIFLLEDGKYLKVSLLAIPSYIIGIYFLKSTSFFNFMLSQKRKNEKIG